MMRYNKIIALIFGTTRSCKPQGKNIARPCKGLNADDNYLLSSIMYFNETHLSFTKKTIL